jgi:hypothetical protein
MAPSNHTTDNSAHPCSVVRLGHRGIILKASFARDPVADLPSLPACAIVEGNRLVGTGDADGTGSHTLIYHKSPTESHQLQDPRGDRHGQTLS